MEKDVARQRVLRWAVSFALLVPIIVLYLCECLRGDGRSFTGFIQYDQASYMADARAYFQGGFHLFYGNPYSPEPNTPRIYFQIQFLLLGLLQKATGWDPGVVYVLFGFVAGLVCLRVALALYEDVAGLRTPVDWLGLVLFIWGGGILELLGLGNHLLTPSGRGIYQDVLAVDPTQGWWFLNLGRNLVYPAEAYYHALAFGLILVTRRGKFRTAIAVGILLLLSHPFTGLQMLMVVTVWAGIESLVLRNRAVPFLFAATMAYLLFLHLLYYVVILNLFEEHRIIFAQWSLAWTESAVASFGADLFVGLLAFWAIHTRALARGMFSRPGARLLVVWFVVSIALAHHDLFFSPKQPLHFTHGYSWCALFLLGVGPLRQLLEAILSWRTLARWATLALILGLAFSDNLIWLGLQIAASVAPRSAGWPQHALTVDDADRDLFRWLMRRPPPHSALLLSRTALVPFTYFAMTYTDYRGWASHNATTPYARERGIQGNAFLDSGTPVPEWSGRTLLVIMAKADSRNAIRKPSWGNSVFQNSEYEVYSIDYP